MKKICCFIAAVALLSGCRTQRPAEQVGRDDAAAVPEVAGNRRTASCNAIYHWKTTFSPTAAEEEFISGHNVGRLYVRMFDVAPDRSWLDPSDRIVPVATTVFRKPVPSDVEIVPTVYITLEAMRAIKGSEAEYADRIVRRIMAMVAANDIGNVGEVQLDCDWTRTTRDSYFALCRSVRDSLHARGIELSSTIRLHQLRDECPPVDRGVLMLYNTGALTDAGETNSILDYAAAAPYLEKAHYALPLDFAYPAFAWGVWFRGGEFRAILRTTDFSDTHYYRPMSDGTYMVMADHYLESHCLKRGDRIRLETSRPDEIMKVKQLAETVLKRKEYSVILYHLDSLTLSKFTDNEIDKLYSRF